MIAIDIGNSRIKWAQFRRGERLLGGASEYVPVSIEQYLDKLQIPLEHEHVFISLVSTDEVKSRLEQWLIKRGYSDYEYVRVSREMFGVKCAYEQPEKLGVDRWLAMIAGYHHESRAEGDALCVLDCGTAVTLDYVDANGVHLGGWIMPGYQTMIHSLAAKTARLEEPRVHEVADNFLLADNTADAINRGVSALLMRGLSAMIEEQSAQLGTGVCCLVTGGDAGWISRGMRDSCIYEPYLVLQGLERVSRESKQIKLRK